MTEPRSFLQIRRPGALPLECGLILVAMGCCVYFWDRQLIEGPAEASLVPVEATLLEASCERKFSGSYGAAHSSVYGVPLARFEYRYNDQVYSSDRYHRQRDTPIGSMPECEKAVNELLSRRLVQAWVDPKNPGFAVLSKELRNPWRGGAFMVVGAALSLLGLYRLWTSRSQAKKQKRRGVV